MKEDDALRFWRTGLLTLAGLALLAAAPAGARELKASVHLPPKNDTVANGYVPFARYVEERSKGALKIKTFLGGALLGPKAAATGIRDGVADLGYVIVGYHPSEFPYGGAFLNELAPIGTDPVPVTAATNELVFLNCANCIAEFKKQGNVFTGVNAVSPMVIMSKAPVNSLADLKGRKIRSAGSIWDRYITAVGATPVNVPSSEQYEALNRGVVEAVMHVPSSMKTYSLWDMVKDVTLLDLGVYRAINTFAFNPKVWASLSPAERRLILEAASDANLDIAHGYNVTGEEALAESKKKGVSIHPPSADIAEHMKKFLADELVLAEETSRTKHGIADAKELIAKMIELNAKWEKRWDESGRDIAKFKEMVRAEIVAKLDPEKYGL